MVEETANLAHSDVVPAPGKEIRNKRGKAPIDVPSPPLTRVRVAAKAAFYMGMSNTISSFAYSIVSPHYIDTSSVQSLAHSINLPLQWIAYQALLSHNLLKGTIH